MGTPKIANYITQLLDELGWNKGTRIPLTNSENKVLESELLARQEEIQQLKEAVAVEKQKCNDLNKYKLQIQTEYQENTKLLFANKAQLEQAIKLKQLSCNEAERFERDIIQCGKQSKNIGLRLEKLQKQGARFLKKADTLKVEVCGERGALQEWRQAIKHSAEDLGALEKFTKQDLSGAKALELKRQRLKVEHDRVEDNLKQLVSNISAEERACDGLSIQMAEAMDQRKHMMNLWSRAVENLRQRDTEIRHLREDYTTLEAEANRIVETIHEQQEFYDQQQGNNMEAERKNITHSQYLSNMRNGHITLVEQNTTLDSEVQTTQRILQSVQQAVNQLHAENRHLNDEIKRKTDGLQQLDKKILHLQEKRMESMDKSKSSEKRAKELEDMLNEEERYANQLTANQERAMHCSFMEQKTLLALKNEEKLVIMQLKASKTVMNKCEKKQKIIEKNLLDQKEVLYGLTYRLETIAAQVSHMEGAQAEREFDAEKLEREKRLKEVLARHLARVSLLERHAAQLNDDMRALTKEIDAHSAEYLRLQARVKTKVLEEEGGEKELRGLREELRRARVEQALLRLRVAHAERNVAGLGNAAVSLETQRLQLDAAMNERLVEIEVRRDMFNVQKRALMEDCGKLRSDIFEREIRIEQLKKRYEIFITSLGKDESGQQLSVAFFKIKFAAERAELRERGAALDADIGRHERDIAALEATLRVMQFAHKHFLHNIMPLKKDAPELEELNSLYMQYYEQRDELKRLSAELQRLERCVGEIAATRAALADKRDQLEQRECEAETELEGARERVTRQESHLENAREVIRASMKRARKLFEDKGLLLPFQMHQWCGNFGEASYNGLRALMEACVTTVQAAKHLASLLDGDDVRERLAKQPRRLQALVHRFIAESVTESVDSIEELSSSSSSSRALSFQGGYVRRLATFRENLAEKLQEKILAEEEPLGQRSAMTLRVVTLNLDQAEERTSRSSMQSRSRTQH